MPLPDSLRQKWREFCKYTSIHGLTFTHAQRHLSKPTRIVWKIIWMIMLALCCYQSTLNLLLYLSCHIAVTTTYVTNSNMDFPSITFTPMSMIRKAEVGNVLDVLLAAWFSDDDREFPLRMKENKKTCYSNMSTNFTENLLKGGFNAIYTMGTEQLLQHGTIDFRRALVKCRWKEQDINCSDAFIEHVGDHLSCFSFNIGNQLVELVQKAQQYENFTQVAPGYGINEKVYDEKNFTVASTNQGLRLLMNVHQNESCGNDKFKRGAGYMVQVHDPNSLKLVMIDSIYYLSPGYHFEFAIRRVLYNRKTEQFGLCFSKQDIYLFPYLQGRNVQSICFAQCAAEYVLKYCKCYPTPLLVSDRIIRANAKRYNMTDSEIKFCWDIVQIRCMTKWRRVLYEESVEKLCPHCKQQCIEGKYEIQITQTRLIPRTVKNINNLEQIRKNYLSVYFYFSSMDVLLIEESQAFTIRDMFIYIGNNIGLFLGMSFISPFELIDILIQLSFGFLKNIFYSHGFGQKVVPVQRKRIKTIIIDPKTIIVRPKPVSTFHINRR